MKSTTVNISFDETLLAEIDAEARRECRSRSELLREAARVFIRRQRRWDDVFALGDRRTEEAGLTGSDVAREIGAARKRRSK